MLTEEKRKELTKILDEYLAALYTEEETIERIDTLTKDTRCWEYGSRGYCFDNEVNRRCYFTSYSIESVLEHAKDWHSNDVNPFDETDYSGHMKNLLRRREAGDWERVPAEESGNDH